MPPCCHGDLTLHSFIQSLFSSCVALTPFWWKGISAFLPLASGSFCSGRCWDEQQEHSLMVGIAPGWGLTSGAFGNWISLKLPYCCGAAGTCGALGILLFSPLGCKLVFFPVVAVSRAGEKHLKEASFHLGWIWLVQAHFQFLLGQEITFWQPDSAGSCGCGYDHCAQVVHWWWYIFIFHPVQGIDRYWILFCPSAQRKLRAGNPSVASSLLEF